MLPTFTDDAFVITDRIDLSLSHSLSQSTRHVYLPERRLCTCCTVERIHIIIILASDVHRKTISRVFLYIWSHPGIVGRDRRAFWRRKRKPAIYIIFQQIKSDNAVGRKKVNQEAPSLIIPFSPLPLTTSRYHFEDRPRINLSIVHYGRSHSSGRRA